MSDALAMPINWAADNSFSLRLLVATSRPVDFRSGTARWRCALYCHLVAWPLGEKLPAGCATVSIHRHCPQGPLSPQLWRHEEPTDTKAERSPRSYIKRGIGSNIPDSLLIPTWVWLSSLLFIPKKSIAYLLCLEKRFQFIPSSPIRWSLVFGNEQKCWIVRKTKAKRYVCSYIVFHLNVVFAKPLVENPATH